jgi:hypothetical protein
MGNFRFTKAKFLLKINTVEKVEVDGQERLNIIESKSEWCRGSDLERTLTKDYENKVNRKVEFCNGEPSEFALNVLYIRKDGQRAYVFKEKENEE